jgi:trimeric autotransporter adhesin
MARVRVSGSLLLTVLASMAYLSSVPVVGQSRGCEFEWNTDLFPREGLLGTATVVHAFDDGTGPALYVVERTSSTRQLMRLEGGQWAPLGGDFNSDVISLQGFDDGTGKALYAAGTFTMAGGVPAMRIARFDGQTWSPLGSEIAGTYVASMAVFDDGTGPALYAGGLFGIAGGNPASNIARWDGQAWSPVGTGATFNGAILDLMVHDAWYGQTLYAAGAFTHIDGNPFNGVARWNGYSWSPLGTGPEMAQGDYVHSLVYYDDGTGPSLYAGGRFNRSVTSPYNCCVARWDGSSWSLVGGGFGNGTGVGLLAFDDGTGPALYASGAYMQAPGVHAPVRWDGQTWSKVGEGTLGAAQQANIVGLTVFNDGTGAILHGWAVRSSSSEFRTWDGSSWKPIGNGISNAPAALLAADLSGAPALYAAGHFAAAGGMIVNHIARWDPASGWSALGAGTNDHILALQLFDNGSGPHLYAGGSFASAGGVSARRIAKWDGQNWSPLAAGIGDPANTWGDWIHALAVFDDGTGPALYAGGDFQEASGTPATNIARWDGQMWTAVGTGTNGIIEALTVVEHAGGTVLYAAGSLTQAGGQPANHIAGWNGHTWTALGDGLDHRVLTLTSFDDGTGPALYAGGMFAQAGGSPAARIARWDGQSWAPLGAGMNNTVLSLHVLDEGAGPALYAGGHFTLAGGTPASGIARWDGQTWSPLANDGIARHVRALAILDDGNGPALLASGTFDRSAGHGPAHIARWGCTPPCYADCDENGTLSIDDFVCFINEFATASSLPPSQQVTSYANCDGSTTEPILTIDDFVCFINAFAQGCP